MRPLHLGATLVWALLGSGESNKGWGVGRRTLLLLAGTACSSSNNNFYNDDDNDDENILLSGAISSIPLSRLIYTIQGTETALEVADRCQQCSMYWLDWMQHVK